MISYELIRREHLPGAVELCRVEEWPSYASDAEITWRALTAPGVTTMVATDGGQVVGFAQMQSDGQIQAHLSLIVVARTHRRQGIGRRLIREAFTRCGGKRVDLTTDGVDPFYESFPHHRMSSYRIYPSSMAPE